MWTWYCFLKRSHIWLLYAVLVAVGFPPSVFWNCCGAPQSQSQGGAWSSQRYCFRATQDSRGVSLPRRWLHNSHALNGAPSFCFQLEFIVVNHRNFMQGKFSRLPLLFTKGSPRAKTVFTFESLEREWRILVGEEDVGRQEESCLSLITALTNRAKKREQLRQMGKGLKSSRIVIIYPTSPVWTVWNRLLK